MRVISAEIYFERNNPRYGICIHISYLGWLRSKLNFHRNNPTYKSVELYLVHIPSSYIIKILKAPNFSSYRFYHCKINEKRIWFNARIIFIPFFVLHVTGASLIYIDSLVGPNIFIIDEDRIYSKPETEHIHYFRE